MARQHRCPQCGAPHRLLSAQSRYRCDYCSALVELREETRFEIWQLGTPRSARDAEHCARRWLREQGIDAAVIEVEGNHWATHWQIVSIEGEEHRVDASRFSHPLLAKLPIPAAARVDALEDLPEPRLSREEVEAAALASFRGDEPRIDVVRLIHQPLQSLRLRIGGRSVAALHLCASDQLLVGPLPDAARRRSARPDLLAAYAAWTLLCLVVGAGVDAWLPRALALAFTLGIGGFAWRTFAGARGRA